ncbi:glycosyltransferase [Morganella morganii]|uniref:GlcNAc-transferase family protein n=1 Tax=Morganella morganii TaxID=582 RepID=UPI000D1DD637|nr:GlcNAc-transferase family protein [Morganella morganii]HAE77515.1 glycosyltransferase [Morganella sp. (in: enterobacteria)]QXO49281.1 glycosyltransferase [Morganella morganii]QXO53121.1 glycosyltransferase [Morganella morganii]QXO56976.1 glycosyltransferase [Morganella morganii]QXO60854.1 glycosyltransferase [Morganella morganii]
MKNTIFISIASYRDSELIPTLKNMVENSASPEKLFISVCWQDEKRDFSVFTDAGATEKDYSESNPDVIRLNYQGATINVHFVQYYQAQGACWARHCCEQYYTDEDYFLQIDSHCRFIPDWDSRLIEYYLSLKKDFRKPIVSGYPPAYTPATEDKEEVRHETFARMVFNQFNDGDIPSFNPIAFLDNKQYARGCFLAGGFTFAAGQFVLDVPNDPQVFFLGEEISMSARAFTHGYDVIYPNKIFLYHFYSRSGCDRIWGDHTQEKKEKKVVEKSWFERDQLSKERVRQVLGIQHSDDIILGKYSLGTERTLEEYEYLTGIMFSEQLIVKELLSNTKPCYFDYIPASREAWIAQLYSDYCQTIKINKSELSANDDNIDYWSLGIFTEDNQLIAMQRLTSEELTRQESGDDQNIYQFEIKLKDKTHLVPKKLRLAPFFTECGWGETVEKVW